MGAKWLFSLNGTANEALAQRLLNAAASRFGYVLRAIAQD